MHSKFPKNINTWGVLYYRRIKRKIDYNPWHRPTFPTGFPASIIGAGELNCRVRNGDRVFPPRYGHQGNGNRIRVEALRSVRK